MEETMLTGESRDIVSDNVSKLKEIFPDVITEDKIDFEKLKLILGEDVETGSERYSFTWPGKTQAIKESQKQSTGTLRPCKEESKNWDSTKNLYVEGDNLEVLKLLQKSYYGKIKAIYIDPPYNTGKEFVYPDDYKDNLDNYLKITSQVLNSGESSGIKLNTNTETQGRYHSNWLNMMYPRLRLARNLLKEEGIIFISIDDNEENNLRKICDEIFGEENFLNHFTWINKKEGRQIQKIGASNTKESILCYSKNIKKIGIFELDLSYLNSTMPTMYNSHQVPVKKDSKGEYIITHGLHNRNPIFNEDTSPTMVFTIWFREKDKKVVFEDPKDDSFVPIFPHRNNDGSHKYLAWRWSKDKISKDMEDLEFVKYKNTYKIYTKRREFNISTLKDVISDISTQDGRLDLNKLNLNKYFDFPKPLKLIDILLKIIKSDEFTVLDFFSGSSTTAHSIFNLNSENNKNVNFILIQLPEQTNEKSEAYKAGFKNICEIGKERIRRAGDKIVEESGNKDLDIGFKVFKLDSSNLEKWDSDYNNLEQTLLTSQDNIKQDRTQEDLIYEIMLKYGIDLTLPIKKHETQKNTIYSIGFGTLLICLDNNITKEIASEILKLTEDSEISRVVFKDNGFASDSDKTNIKEILKTNNIEEFITI